MEARQLTQLDLNLILKCRRSLNVKGAKLIMNLCFREEKKRKLAGSYSRSDQMNSHRQNNRILEISRVPTLIRGKMTDHQRKLP